MKIATVCTGIGSPEQALENLGIDHEIVFGCEIDKYARQTYLANFNPKMMLEDMTKETWEGSEYYADLLVGGIPCQAFSLAGKRLGELDPRGLLFYDFYRYVKVQQPKYFIIENVKGLLSDNDGATFRNWINLLGQSENGNPFFFPHEDSLMYNLHWQILNTKDYGLPQNRERVFLIGIRNDLPNDFVFPKGVPLTKRLKDILETNVDEKYYLSDAHLESMSNWKSFKNPLRDNLYDGSEVMSCLTARGDGEYHSGMKLLKVENVGNTNPSGNGMNGNVFSENGISPTLTTNKGEGIKIQIASAIKSGYEIATEGDARILNPLKGNTEFGWHFEQNVYDEEGVTRALKAGGGSGNIPKVISEIKIGAMRGRNPENPSDRTTGAPTQQMLEINENGTSNCLTSVQKDNVVVECVKVGTIDGYEQDGRIYADYGISSTLDTKCSKRPLISTDYHIRKLTPLECFRLQGFPDSFEKPVSDTQLYKQAGNTISVPVIQSILKNLLK